MPKSPGRAIDLQDENTPEDEALLEGQEPVHRSSLTAVAADAMRSGVTPFEQRDEQIPGEDLAIQAGDPDADPLENEYVGDETPGGTNSTPDHNDVDAIGAVYGIPEPEGELQLGADLISPRDENRWETSFESKAAEEQDNYESDEDADTDDNFEVSLEELDDDEDSDDADNEELN